MHLGVNAVAFSDNSLLQLAQNLRALGINAVEFGTGGYHPKTLCNPGELLADESSLASFRDTLAEFELDISAFNLAGEPLNPDPAVAGPFDEDFRDTCALAARIGVNRIVLLAGLPAASSDDKHPNWVINAYPLRNRDVVRWQWDNRVIPYWKEHGKIAEDHGIRLCFEMIWGDVLYKPSKLLRLSEEVGPVIGCNLDPSHLIWQGMDIPEVIRALGDVIYHVHAKDYRIDPHNVRVNGIFEERTFEEVQERSWLYRTVGFGQDERFWRDVITTLRLVGYEDVISIEHEDVLIDPDEGVKMAADLLGGIILDKPPAGLFAD